MCGLQSEVPGLQAALYMLMPLPGQPVPWASSLQGLLLQLLSPKAWPRARGLGKPKTGSRGRWGQSHRFLPAPAVEGCPRPQQLQDPSHNLLNSLVQGFSI